MYLEESELCLTRTEYAPSRPELFIVFLAEIAKCDIRFYQRPQAQPSEYTFVTLTATDLIEDRQRVKDQSEGGIESAVSSDTRSTLHESIKHVMAAR
ncbi:hypothetical protein A4G86_09035 [Burkholderia pseudomallei]|nr:hypothetical protein AQ876_10730 [Burkholderia pseudomallei]RAQ93656.1 hypothetical protein A4G86_09035 [Burkholderia pseudomallei]